jgi:hypothetical protein
MQNFKKALLLLLLFMHARLLMTSLCFSMSRPWTCIFVILNREKWFFARRTARTNSFLKCILHDTSAGWIPFDDEVISLHANAPAHNNNIYVCMLSQEEQNDKKLESRVSLLYAAIHWSSTVSLQTWLTHYDRNCCRAWHWPSAWRLDFGNAVRPLSKLWKEATSLGRRA